MAYSATLAHMLGKLSSDEHSRILSLFSRAGLSMDHPQFDEAILEKGTAAILKTRDGKLRAAVPSPLGQCEFLNDLTHEQLFEALRRHKRVVAEYPRRGEGVEAYVDASDTGYTMNAVPIEQESLQRIPNGNTAIADQSVKKDDVKNGQVDGLHPLHNGSIGKLNNVVANAAGEEQSGSVPRVNGHANGYATGHVKRHEHLAQKGPEEVAVQGSA